MVQRCFSRVKICIGCCLQVAALDAQLAEVETALAEATEARNTERCLLICALDHWASHTIAGVLCLEQSAVSRLQ